METLQTTTPARLHHLHVTSEDPARLSEFYARMLGFTVLSLEQGMYVLSGKQRALLISDGQSRSLACAAYAVANTGALARLRKRLVASACDPADIRSPLLQPGSFAIADPQGRHTVFGVANGGRASDALPARLQHVVFQTTMLEAMVKFYVEKLGYTVSDEVVNDDNRLVVCFLRSDDEHHSLALFRGSQNELDHHCYETGSWNDIRDWADRFAQARIPIFFGPGRHGPGNNLFFMVTDPDGNRLEFSAELQTVPPGRAPGTWPDSEYTLNSWGRAWVRT
jgi:catechol 2,3-dioxygenase-like lactoylglutathione lyase family enzyme